ncbi:hypothetical protein [Rhodococcus sp. IEGM 1408]|uniref:hypothetical protein n=1 Tax=Rhodococcus sp. IEGM 1408 TaxID=3082220 RepID=UPI0029545A11|nr:hypothetical protein [Rhodococcus sp. IEGM 1408]MDV8003133.1 hypothetical protein [Rhodococcus sp. IEGM 1408]
MTSPQGFLSEAHRQRWAQATYSIRACELALVGAVDPAPNSPLAFADALYPWEKVSAWSRNYLSAGIEHMLLWADLVAPYSFDKAHINHVRYRPYLLMGRAGLESGAHAVWLLADVDEPHKCVRRFLRMMYKDFGYQRKAQLAGGFSVEHIDQRMTDTLQRAADLGVGVVPKDKPPGYEGLVREAAVTVGGDADRWVFLWNAASGAGHGQNWFGMVGYDVEIGEEYELGHFRSTQVPDAVFITEVVEAAADTLLWGVLRWLVLAGYPPTRLKESIVRVHERMPKKA